MRALFERKFESRLLPQSTGMSSIPVGWSISALPWRRTMSSTQALPETGSHVDVQFITVHSAQGLEVDHVIVPRVTSETLGFPSRVVDDPVLQPAMSGGDSHEFAEERRLFYVAMTRARQTVTLVTVAKKESVFVSELVRDHGQQRQGHRWRGQQRRGLPGLQDWLLGSSQGALWQIPGLHQRSEVQAHPQDCCRHQCGERRSRATGASPLSRLEWLLRGYTDPDCAQS